MYIVDVCSVPTAVNTIYRRLNVLLEQPSSVLEQSHLRPKEVVTPTRLLVGHNRWRKGLDQGLANTMSPK